MQVFVCAKTDLGKIRALNQDHHAWWVPSDRRDAEKRGVLLVVADGMGGGNAGDLASRLAVTRLVESYSGEPALPPEQALVLAVQEANEAVYRESLKGPELHGMGTTCTALVVLGQDLLVAQVGDSRAYLLHENGLLRLTRDHSLVHELVEQGRITEEEARVHPQRHVVTRALGVGASVEVEGRRWPALFRPGSTLLLCSDGLHGVLPDPEIERLAAEADLRGVAESLVEEANRRGGPDNITVLLARWENSATPGDLG